MRRRRLKSAWDALRFEEMMYGVPRPVKKIINSSTFFFFLF